MMKNTKESKMPTGISEQIAERRAQAMEREIFRKAKHVALHLGKIDDDKESWRSNSENARIVYVGSSLIIEFSHITYDNTRSTLAKADDYVTLRITADENTVFLHENGILDGYAPGKCWETELDSLQTAADGAKHIMCGDAEQEKLVRGKAYSTALHKAWGLPIPRT